MTRRDFFLIGLIEVEGLSPLWVVLSPGFSPGLTKPAKSLTHLYIYLPFFLTLDMM